jgi:hypothetical protein
MTEADCKLITEKLLGECWHVFKYKDKQLYCENCHNWSSAIKVNRTFTDPQDFFAVFDKLVEKGEWEVFAEWAAFEDNYGAESMASEYSSFIVWLLSKDASGVYRLCRLIGEYLKKGDCNNESA